MSYVNLLDFAPPDGDWTPAFDDAIAAALAGGYAGVLVPASRQPYVVRQRAGAGIPRPSIDLRGQQIRRFELKGEGERSVVAMAGPGSWRLLHIGGGATDVLVKGLRLDGAQLEDADNQSHLVVVGTSATVAGGAQHVSIVDCTLSHAAGDGIAIVPASSTATGEDVDDITIAHCRFLDSKRSGISNQRRARRVSIVLNHFAATADQDIDLEPTGDLPESGPSDYLIFGNTMVRAPRAGVSVTLSGIRPESPSRRIAFVHNRVLGGSVGLHDAHDTSIIGNYIESGEDQQGTLLRAGGSVERLTVTGNTVVRTAAAGPGTLLNVSAEGASHGFPRSVRIQSNHFVTRVPVPAGEALITFTNASGILFRDNEISSFAGQDLPIAVKFDTTGIAQRDPRGWQVVDNTFQGDALTPPEFDQPGLGSFRVGVALSVRGPSSTDMRVSGNTFSGCPTGVRIRASSPGQLTTIPAVTGNTGAGIATELEHVDAILVDGNQQLPGANPATPAGARYAGPDQPDFPAPLGSLFSRTGITPGPRLFINTPTGWSPVQ